MMMIMLLVNVNLPGFYETTKTVLSKDLSLDLFTDTHVMFLSCSLFDCLVFVKWNALWRFYCNFASKNCINSKLILICLDTTEHS